MTTRITRIVTLSSPLVSPKPSIRPVYDGRKILKTKTGDVDSLRLYDGLNKIEAIVGVQIGQDGLSLELTLLIKCVDTPATMAVFIADTDALLRSCAEDQNSELFPELAAGIDLVISFERQ